MRGRRRLLRLLFSVVGLAVALAPPLLLASIRAAASAVLLAPSFWAIYLLGDAFLVHRWRTRILAAWRAGILNLGVFAEGIATLPTLPKPSTRAVLDTLPILPPLQDRDLARAQREVLAALSDWHFAEGMARMLLPAAILGLASLAAALALYAGTFTAMEGVLLILGLISFAFAVRAAPALLLRRHLASRLDRLTATEHAGLLILVPDIIRSPGSRAHAIELLRRSQSHHRSTREPDGNC